jgi:hypothetical protein
MEPDRIEHFRLKREMLRLASDFVGGDEVLLHRYIVTREELEGPTIAAVTASKDAPDERVLPPIPIFARQKMPQNRGPYNFSDDSVIEYPGSDGRVSELGVFVCVQISGNSRTTIFG